MVRVEVVVVGGFYVAESVVFRRVESSGRELGV